MAVFVNLCEILDAEVWSVACIQEEEENCARQQELFWGSSFPLWCFEPARVKCN